jgi:hypothetical protein
MVREWVYNWPPVAENKDEKGSERWEGGKSVFATDVIFFFLDFVHWLIFH